MVWLTAIYYSFGLGCIKLSWFLFISNNKKKKNLLAKISEKNKRIYWLYPQNIGNCTRYSKICKNQSFNLGTYYDIYPLTCSVVFFIQLSLSHIFIKKKHKKKVQQIQRIHLIHNRNAWGKVKKTSIHKKDV